MTIDQLTAANERIDDAQDLADMECVTLVLAPRLMAEVWSLRGLLIRADKYLAHREDCSLEGMCTCGLNDLLDTLEKVQR